MFFNVLGLLLLGVSLPWTESKSTYDADVKLFRNDYIYVPESETYYKQHKITRTWFDAVATCKAEGAHLATPLTLDEAQILQVYKTDNSWLGIHDLQSEGIFSTLNGTPATEIYTNWRSDEPNDADDEEDCVLMDKGGQYNDEVCTRTFGFVCTKHRSEVKPNTVCETNDADYIHHPESDRCYKLHTRPKKWQEAYAICHHEEASLAVINSQAEADLFKETLAKSPEETLIGHFNKKLVLMGYSAIVFPGEFTTINGETPDEAGYNVWTMTDDDSDLCGGMLRDGKLSAVDCKTKAFFFCEKTLNSNISKPQPAIQHIG